jgi:hypothetical protein
MAWKRPKAAEDAANLQKLQKQHESVARATTLPRDSGRSPAANVLQPSLAQSNAKQVKRSIEKYRGTWCFVCQLVQNPVLRKVHKLSFQKKLRYDFIIGSW